MSYTEAGLSEGSAGVVQRYLTAVSNSDYAAIDDLLSDDLRHDFSRNGVEVDISGNNAVGLHQATGPIEVKVLDIFGHGDQTASRFSLTVSGDAVEGAAPGSSTEVTGIAIVRIADGKIVEVAHEMDTLGMLLDLGWSVQRPA
jgi:ketosteroid isomerase-like protein